jgi:transposase
MAPSRGALVPKGHFSELDPAVQVILVVDRYSAYKSLVKEFPMIWLAFCWAHVRRDFLEGARNWPVIEAWMLSWVVAIGEIYHLNKQRLEVWNETVALADQSALFIQRHQDLQERLARMNERCEEQLAQATMHSAQKKVLTSLKNHWSGLTLFVEHPQVPMDNNQAERSQRVPVIGRKNYYGSGAIWSAELAAMLFSVLQTIIGWGLNPRHWLQDFLAACAQNGGNAPAQLTPFLPWSMDEQRREMLKRPLPNTSVLFVGKPLDILGPNTS